MKVAELREIIKKHKKEDLHYLIVELYKLVPKNKKEDYQIDTIISNPKQDKAKQKATSKEKPIEEISTEVEIFIDNAMADNYLIPNNVIAKKDRSKWRFIVKRFYKEINEAIVDGNNKQKCANELRKIYELLSFASSWQIFTTYDVFDSIGITQVDFFTNTIRTYRDCTDLKEFCSISCKLAHNNNLDRHTLQTDLSWVNINYCNTPDMKYIMIDELKSLHKLILEEPDKKTSSINYSETMSYEKKNKLNKISETLLIFYGELEEFDNAINTFKKMYIEKDNEIMLYVLLREFFTFNKPQIMLKIINDNLNAKLRKSILSLKEYIETKNELPQYF